MGNLSSHALPSFIGPLPSINRTPSLVRSSKLTDTSKPLQRHSSLHLPATVKTTSGYLNATISKDSRSNLTTNVTSTQPDTSKSYKTLPNSQRSTRTDSSQPNFVEAIPQAISPFDYKNQSNPVEMPIDKLASMKIVNSPLLPNLPAENSLFVASHVTSVVNNITTTNIFSNTTISNITSNTTSNTTTNTYAATATTSISVQSEKQRNIVLNNNELELDHASVSIINTSVVSESKNKVIPPSNAINNESHTPFNVVTNKLLNQSTCSVTTGVTALPLQISVTDTVVLPGVDNTIKADSVALPGLGVTTKVAHTNSAVDRSSVNPATLSTVTKVVSSTGTNMPSSIFSSSTGKTSSTEITSSLKAVSVIASEVAMEPSAIDNMSMRKVTNVAIATSSKSGTVVTVASSKVATVSAATSPKSATVVTIVPSTDTTVATKLSPKDIVISNTLLPKVSNEATATTKVSAVVAAASPKIDLLSEKNLLIVCESETENKVPIDTELIKETNCQNISFTENTSVTGTVEEDHLLTGTAHSKKLVTESRLCETNKSVQAEQLKELVSSIKRGSPSATSSQVHAPVGAENYLLNELEKMINNRSPDKATDRSSADAVNASVSHETVNNTLMEEFDDSDDKADDSEEVSTDEETKEVIMPCIDTLLKMPENDTLPANVRHCHSIVQQEQQTSFTGDKKEVEDIVFVTSVVASQVSCVGSDVYIADDANVITSFDTSTQANIVTSTGSYILTDSYISSDSSAPTDSCVTSSSSVPIDVNIISSSNKLTDVNVTSSSNVPTNITTTSADAIATNNHLLLKDKDKLQEHKDNCLVSKSDSDSLIVSEKSKLGNSSLDPSACYPLVAVTSGFEPLSLTSTSYSVTSDSLNDSTVPGMNCSLSVAKMHPAKTNNNTLLPSSKFDHISSSDDLSNQSNNSSVYCNASANNVINNREPITVHDQCNVAKNEGQVSVLEQDYVTNNGGPVIVKVPQLPSEQLIDQKLTTNDSVISKVSPYHEDVNFEIDNDLSLHSAAFDKPQLALLQSTAVPDVADAQSTVVYDVAGALSSDVTGIQHVNDALSSDVTRIRLVNDAKLACELLLTASDEKLVKLESQSETLGDHLQSEGHDTIKSQSVMRNTLPSASVSASKISNFTESQSVNNDSLSVSQPVVDDPLSASLSVSESAAYNPLSLPLFKNTVTPPAVYDPLPLPSEPKTSNIPISHPVDSGSLSSTISKPNASRVTISSTNVFSSSSVSNPYTSNNNLPHPTSSSASVPKTAVDVVWHAPSPFARLHNLFTPHTSESVHTSSSSLAYPWTHIFSSSTQPSSTQTSTQSPQKTRQTLSPTKASATTNRNDISSSKVTTPSSNEIASHKTATPSSDVTLRSANMGLTSTNKEELAGIFFFVYIINIRLYIYIHIYIYMYVFIIIIIIIIMKIIYTC